jgi:hypothetical protein
MNFSPLVPKLMGVVQELDGMFIAGTLICTELAVEETEL